ncbi:unnamed protein product [Vicia faba]|nr:unnamed protein product [Vicia faba]
MRIIRQKANVSSIHDGNIVNNNGGDVLNHSALTENSYTTLCAIKSSSYNQRNHLPSTTNANISITSSNIQSDVSDEECSTDEYFSDNSCEFINKKGDDETFSCSDDDQYYDNTSTPVYCPNSGYSDIVDPAIEYTHCGA